MMHATVADPAKSSLDGLWVLLVQHDDQAAAETTDHLPVMARAGESGTYLLAFKNMPKARQFMLASELSGCEPRMVVKANRSKLLQVAQAAGATGVLVDYDPATQKYGSAAELY